MSTSAGTSAPCEVYFLLKASMITIAGASLELFVTRIARVAIGQRHVDRFFICDRPLQKAVFLHPAHQRFDPRPRRLVVLPSAVIIGLLEQRDINIRRIVLERLKG